MVEVARDLLVLARLRQHVSFAAGVAVERIELAGKIVIVPRRIGADKAPPAFVAAFNFLTGDDFLEQQQGVRRLAPQGGGLARYFVLIGAAAAREALAEVDAAADRAAVAAARAGTELVCLDAPAGGAGAANLERRGEPAIAGADDRNVRARRQVGGAVRARSPRLPPVGRRLEVGMEQGVASHAVSPAPHSLTPIALAPRPKRCAISSPAVMTRICSTDTAAMVGSISMRILSNIFLGNVICGPARIIATTSSSKDVMKASTAAVTMLGRISGNVTRRIACQRDAPSPSAACSRLSSSPRRLAPRMMITNGSARIVWASAMPYQAPISLSLANRP